MVMQDRASYVSRNWEKLDVYHRPGLIPPNTIECLDEETGEVETFTRISDDSLRCLPATIMVDGKPVLGKCERDECHRRDPGHCQCGLHPPFVLPDGKLNRGVKLDRA